VFIAAYQRFITGRVKRWDANVSASLCVQSSVIVYCFVSALWQPSSGQRPGRAQTIGSEEPQTTGILKKKTGSVHNARTGSWLHFSARLEGEPLKHQLALWNV
jgi:hypothetical protein